MFPKVLLTFVIIFITNKYINAGFIPTPVCGSNEEYTDCGSACPRYCGDNETRVCTAQCVPGCFCKKGFIWHKTVCISEEQCKYICPKNEEYKDCGSACPPICGVKHKNCIQSCTNGCFCKQGYIRKSVNDICIPEKQCPSTCGRNEVFMKCGTACPQICGYPKVTGCTKQCVTGCFCKPGYIRKDNKCILQSKCDNLCGENEIYLNCRGCFSKCEKNKNVGCFCKPGFVRCYNSTCIPECECETYD